MAVASIDIDQWGVRTHLRSGSRRHGGGCFGFRRLRQFTLRRRAPGAPDIDIGLVQRVERQGVADACLVGGGADAERAGRIRIVQRRDQVQQDRRPRLHRQAGDARQACCGAGDRRLAHRRRGQQQPPVLARPFGDRPLPGLAGEDPGDHRQRMPGRRLVAGLHLGKQAGAPVDAAQERGHRRRRRGVGCGGGHGQVMGTPHLSRAIRRRPAKKPLDTPSAGGSASNGAGCGQTSCAQPSRNRHAGRFHAIGTRRDNRVSRSSD